MPLQTAPSGNCKERGEGIESREELQVRLPEIGGFVKLARAGGQSVRWRNHLQFGETFV